MKPSSIKDILDVFKLSYDPSGKVSRAEIVDAAKVSHIADPSKPILPWHGYVGQPLPAETLAQVKEVREMVQAFDPKLPKVPAWPAIAEARCDPQKSFMFIDEPAFRAKLVAEIQRDAQGLKALADAETDGKVRDALRVEYMKVMAFKHLMGGREGPTSAVNTYDPAIVTWGMGWALKGFLPRVLGRIYELEAASSADPSQHFVQKFFYLCGFLYDTGTYYVVDTERETVWAHPLRKARRKKGEDAAEPKGYEEGEAVRMIHGAVELHFMWVQAARDDLTRATLTRAQRDVFASGTGTVPQAEKIQTAALYTFIAHLQHWTGDKFDVVAWATGPNARPPLTAALPSEKGDEELAIQAVHRFYSKRSPDDGANVFTQVQKYWRQMVDEDANDEGLKDFKPVYPIMSAGPVASVPADHLGAMVDRRRHVLYDLGPLEDFGRAPPPAPSPSLDSPPPFIGPPAPPSEPRPPTAAELAREQAQQARERSSWAWVFKWLPRW